MKVHLTKQKVSENYLNNLRFKIESVMETRSPHFSGAFCRSVKRRQELLLNHYHFLIQK